MGGSETSGVSLPLSVTTKKTERVEETVTSTRNESISPVELSKSLLIYALDTILSYSLSPSSTITASLQT